MANFCTNCGTRLRSDDNFCYNCGARVDSSGFKQNNSYSDSADKRNAKSELKRVVGGKFIYNPDFSDRLLENGLDIPFTGRSIRRQVEREIDSGQVKSGQVESRVNQLISEYRAKKEEERKSRERIDEMLKASEKREKARTPKEKKMTPKQTQTTVRGNGGYCGLNCRHCYEEFLDSYGGIVGDFDAGGNVEYYCALGHQVVLGSFCEYYE